MLEKMAGNIIFMEHNFILSFSSYYFFFQNCLFHNFIILMFLFWCYCTRCVCVFACMCYVYIWHDMISLIQLIDRIYFNIISSNSFFTLHVYILKFLLTNGQNSLHSKSHFTIFTANFYEWIMKMFWNALF